LARESSIRLLGYISGLLIVLFGAVHLATHSFLGVQGYSESLRYISVISRYRNPIFAFTLEMLLIMVAYHGLAGVRTVLLESRQGKKWEKIVNITLTMSGIILVIFGSNTVLTNYLG